MADLRDAVAISAPPIIAEPAKATAAPGRAAAPAVPHGWVLIGAPLLAYIALLVVIFVSAVALVIEFDPSPARIDLVTHDLAENFPVVQALNAVLYGIIFFMMWLLLPKSGAAALTSWFVRVPRWAMLLAVLNGLVLALVLIWGQVWLVAHHVTSFHTTAGEKSLVPIDVTDLAPSLLFVALIVPIVEETYFRGLMLRWLRGRSYTVVAILVSAALFAAIHGKFLTHDPLEGWILTAFLGFVGVVAAIWAVATRSLWPSIAIHGTYNAAVVTLPLVAGWLGV